MKSNHLDTVTKNGLALEQIPEAERTVEICVAALNQNALSADFVPESVWPKLKNEITNAKEILKNYLLERPRRYQHHQAFQKLWTAKTAKPITNELTVNNFKQINRLLNEVLESDNGILVSHTYTEGVCGGITECELAEKRTRKYLATNIKLMIERTSSKEGYLTLMMGGRQNGSAPKKGLVTDIGFVHSFDRFGGDIFEDVPSSYFDTEVLSEPLKNLLKLTRRCFTDPVAFFCGHEIINYRRIVKMQVTKTKIIFSYDQGIHGYGEITIDFSSAAKVVLLAKPNAILNHAGTHDNIAIQDAKDYEQWQESLGNKTKMIQWDKQKKRVI